MAQTEGRQLQARHSQDLVEADYAALLASITGGIAEAIFGIPEKIAATVWGYLTDELDTVVKWFLTHIDL